MLGKEKEYHALKKKLEEVEHKLGEANAEVVEANRHGMPASKRNHVKLIFFQIEKLKERLAAGQSNAAKLYADIAALKLNSRRLYGTLHRAVNSVKEALQIYEGPKESEEIIASKRANLLNNLLQILNRAEMSEKERYL